VRAVFDGHSHFNNVQRPFRDDNIGHVVVY
jgi:hypothetical protein